MSAPIWKNNTMYDCVNKNLCEKTILFNVICIA